MPDLEAEKRAAAIRAVDEIQDDMLVGLGSGSTAAYAIRELGARAKAGLRIKTVVTSSASEALALSVGLAPLDFGTISRVDVTIDGADEITRGLQAIKGGGGALLREKIVGAASDRMIVIVDSSKPVATLGAFKLPIEVLPFASAWVQRAISAFAPAPILRVRDGKIVFTDQGNLLFDIPFGSIDNPTLIADQLSSISGVIEHGLFLTEIDMALVGTATGVDVFNKPAPRSR